MNILPKKSWHVRNIDNIERVRKDEAKAAEEEKKQLARAAVAVVEGSGGRGRPRKTWADCVREDPRCWEIEESDIYDRETWRIAEREARTTFLRDRARSKGAISLVGSEVVPVDASNKIQNVNFFSDLEKQTKEVNKDHEAEKKAEQEAWEKKVGILTHLGQSVSEGEKTLVHGGRVELPEIDPDVKRKDMLDPLNLMKRYLGHSDTTSTTKKQKQSREQSSDKNNSYSEDAPSSKHAYQSHIPKSRHSSHGKSSKKKKHKHKHRRERDEKTPVDIERLRAERLKRENEERKRTERLLSGAGASDKQAEDVGVTDARDGRYNSQFHPHLARQRLSKDSSRNWNIAGT